MNVKLICLVVGIVVITVCNVFLPIWNYLKYKSKKRK